MYCHRHRAAYGFFLRLAGKIKTEDGEDFKQLVVHCIVKRVATAVYNLTGLENLYLYTALATAGITYVLVKNLVVSVQRQKATDVCGPV